MTSCLDLIHVPAQSLWIEWTEAPRRAELAAIDALGVQGASDAQRAGALITASANGRAGEIRTFWSTHAELAYVSPVIVRFDLDGVCTHEASADPVIGSGWATVTAPVESGLDDFLEHLRFHFDEEWAAYYRDQCETREHAKGRIARQLGDMRIRPADVVRFPADAFGTKRSAAAPYAPGQTQSGSRTRRQTAAAGARGSVCSFIFDIDS